MAANVLNSPRAAEMSIYVVRAFIMMRRDRGGSRTLLDKLHDLEKKIATRLDVHERAIAYLLGEIKKIISQPALPATKRRRIGFVREDE